MESTGIVVWSQWPELNAPAGVTVLSDVSGMPSASDRERITYYVQANLSGAKGSAPSQDMPHLKVLQVLSAGYNYAVPFVRPGITLCNARGVHDQSTAELALGLAIALRRGFPHFWAGQLRGEWDHIRTTSFADSKVAIVGYGSIGQTVGRMLSGFDVDVTPFTSRGLDGTQKATTLADSIHKFDIVFLTLPLTEESTKLFDSNMLARMKTGAILVNVARGQIVDTDALVAELMAGRLLAGLDVTDPEPLPAGHPIWSAPNCIITPHVAADTTAFEPRGRRLVEEQLQRLAAGEDVINIVAVG